MTKEIEKQPINEKLHDLQRILLEQEQDITTLCFMNEQLRNEQLADTKQQKSQLTQLHEKQEERFKLLDDLLFTSRRLVKKGEPKNKEVETFSKEVRKLEAGLRTLRLFSEDIAIMGEANFYGQNRKDERLYYFDHRSQQLQVEIHALRQKIK